MLLGGMKPDLPGDRARRKLRLFLDLDTAIGKAEDVLLADEDIGNDYYSSFYDSRTIEEGFRLCLRKIDAEVSINHVTPHSADCLL